MSQDNPVRVFVTHNFAANDDYHRVYEYLESAPNFFYVNCSAPEKIPTVGGSEALKDELRKQIQAAEIVIVLDPVYRQNRDLVTFQMNAAGAHDLALIAMESFGSVAEIADEIKERVAETVSWNDRMIVDAILRQARHQDTHRWDTIEFEL
jgi:hypothetical protein